MDIRNGHIYSADQVAAMPEEDRRFMRPMAVDPTPEQRRRGSVGRNDPCPCNSGKKFKRCCLFAREADVRAASRQRAVDEAGRAEAVEKIRETYRRGGSGIQFPVEVGGAAMAPKEGD